MKHVHLYLILIFLSIASCKKDDPEPCPNLYTGKNCDIQITPSFIRVLATTLTNFPPTDNGAGWDLTSGPDIYIVIKQNGQVLLNTDNDWKQNASPGISWQKPFSTIDAISNITIEVWDYDDFDDDDFMGAIQGPIYTDTNGFPQFIDATSGGISLKLGPVEYL